MENQEKQDAELDNLVLSLARMTPAVESVRQIADPNLEDTATEMLKLIEDASLFILNYKSRTILGKTWYSIVNSSAQDEISDLVNKFTRLKGECDTRVGTQTLIVGAETLAVGAETLQVGTRTLNTIHSNSKPGRCSEMGNWDDMNGIRLLDDQENLAKLNPAGHAIYNPGGACLPGTRVGVIERIVNWSQGNDKGGRMLWVYGFAGLGKSSVAASVCQRLEAENRLAASFFCKRDDPALRDARCLLNTIVYGLAIRNEAYKRAVADAIREDQQICGAPMQRRYASLIQGPMRSLGHDQAPRTFVVVVDALDETQRDENRASVLTYLRDMYQLAPWLKIIVTSRPDDDIKTEFGGDDEHMTSLNIADHDAADDVHMFVQQRMAGIAKKKRIEWPDEKIRQLADRANGLFVWSETACKFIAGGFSPDERLEQVLHLSPSTEESHPLAALDDLFTTAIRVGIEDNSADNRRHVVRCIGAVIATSSRTPLPVASLEQLLYGQIKPGVLRSVVDSLGSVLYEDGASGPVRVFHPSFEDYITDPNRSNAFYVDLGQKNTTLAVCCLDNMLRGLKFNICDLETSHVLNRDIPDLATRVQNGIAQH
ncbi:hypothetical protein FRC06_010571, partial [Ceratobasidium sp. 370]